MDDSVIPSKVINASACICDIHPEDAAFSWTSESSEDRKKWREKLGLSKAIEAEIHDLTDLWFEEKRIGWGGVFYSIEDAIDYQKKCVGILDRVVVLEIGTTEEFAKEFIEEFGPKSEKEGEIGIVHALKRSTLISPHSETVGFDTFGFESGGSFHSFICNSLEKDYKNKLGLSFSKSGLLMSFEEAVRASEYNNDPDVGAEPVLWQPWIVNKIDANNKECN